MRVDYSPQRATHDKPMVGSPLFFFPSFPGEKRAGLVQRCLEEVSRDDGAEEGFSWMASHQQDLYKIY